MISVEQARKILYENSERGKITTIELRESLGTVLAEDIYSSIDVPSFDNSAMDGYALKFDGESESWRLQGEIQAGDTAVHEVASGEATRIFTGAKMPEGADTVIQQELIERKGDRIIYNHEKISTGSNVRLTGSQCKAGDQILKKGTKVTSGVVGLLASVGVSKMKIFTPPSVAYVVTGNELKEPGEPLKTGEIYNSNGPMLEALLKQIGIKEIVAKRASDDKEKLQQIINSAWEQQDVLILSGGISVGDYDFVKECLEKVGVKELFYKIKQRPGKPMYVGKKGDKMVFALPGNPASVLSCYVQYVKPCLQNLMGKKDAWQPDNILPLLEDVKKKPGFTFFMKAKKEDGKVKILTGQQSFNLQAFSTADCLVELEEEAEVVPKGTLVKIYNL
ncbi:molybdopterin molybdotransferase MoeA [Salinimicrobium sediminilitoris]|uniref:molybdopterin molybdotransferase MoeA n=1 Tax=Salinimicrobium sediminilitoris TaxID=2876715 RepID=UPI001E572DC1|nr:gephyrin-like molybdotransferase Glp [Salinimicrobium sediminilitoris]MCC8358354.1 molybdopterin molybdotransferase MoeA [Salinimicrobium sediminilitoris]